MHTDGDDAALRVGGDDGDDGDNDGDRDGDCDCDDSDDVVVVVFVVAVGFADERDLDVTLLEPGAVLLLTPLLLTPPLLLTLLLLLTPPLTLTPTSTSTLLLGPRSASSAGLTTRSSRSWSATPTRTDATSCGDIGSISGSSRAGSAKTAGSSGTMNGSRRTTGDEVGDDGDDSNDGDGDGDDGSDSACDRGNVFGDGEEKAGLGEDKRPKPKSEMKRARRLGPKPVGLGIGGDRPISRV